jgi:outer membrane protein OmpA-like peptidoglycan-associated protein
VNRRRVHVRSTILLIGLPVLPVVHTPPVPEGPPAIGEKIYFEEARAEITPASYPVLDAITTILRRERERFPQLALEGHAAANERSPMRLSLARASAVRLSLIQRGIDGDRLFARASGATVPACPHDRGVCWERERRVEFAVLCPSPPVGIEPATDANVETDAEPEADVERGPPPHRRAVDPELLDRVGFARGTAVLRPSALSTLDLVAGFLKGTPSALSIEGHAAADERHPDDLARARAQAVRVYLIACGVSGAALVVRSQGSAKPACAERSPSCRAQSRRVELRFSEAVGAAESREPRP